MKKDKNGRTELERGCTRERKVNVMWMSTERSCCSPADSLTATVCGASASVPPRVLI